MLKRILLTVCLAFLAQTVQAQTEKNTCGQFDPKNAKEILEILAHPALGGRGTGQPGFDLAGLILSRELKNSGFLPLPNNPEEYFQIFKAYTGRIAGGETSRNVMGYLPGEIDEFVIIGAHYDHLGIEDGKIFPGADDNASGVTAVLEIARIVGNYARSTGGLRRAVVVGFWGAEEDGLVGSEAFAHSTLVPLDKRVAYINLDMVGRNDPGHLVAIGSAPNKFFDILSPDLASILNDENDRLYRPFVFDEVPGDLFYRSDQYSFFEASPEDGRLPVLFFYTSEHPDYHATTDTADKIDVEKLTRVSCLAYAILLRLANTEKRPVYISVF